MKPARTTQIMLGLACAYPADQAASKAIRLMHLAIFLIVITSLNSALITSVVFFLEFISIDLEEALYTIWQISAVLNSLYAVVYLRLSQPRFKSLFDKLSKVYSLCKKICINIIKYVFLQQKPNDFEISDSNKIEYQFLMEANIKCLQSVDLYIKFMLFAFVSTMSTIGTLMLYAFIQFDKIDVQQLYQPLKLR